MTASGGAGRQCSDHHGQPSVASLPRIQSGAARSSHASASQHRSPKLQEELGIVCHRPGEGGGPTKGCCRPSEELPPRPSCQPSFRAHPAGPLQMTSPETPPPAKAAAPGLQSPGWSGRVGLATVTLGRCSSSGVWGLF